MMSCNLTRVCSEAVDKRWPTFTQWNLQGEVWKVVQLSLAGLANVRNVSTYVKLNDKLICWRKLTITVEKHLANVIIWVAIHSNASLLASIVMWWCRGARMTSACQQQRGACLLLSGPELHPWPLAVTWQTWSWAAQGSFRVGWEFEAATNLPLLQVRFFPSLVPSYCSDPKLLAPV